MYPGSASKFHEVDMQWTISLWGLQNLFQGSGNAYGKYFPGYRVANSYITKNKNNPGILSLCLVTGINKYSIYSKQNILGCRCMHPNTPGGPRCKDGSLQNQINLSFAYQG